MVTLEDIKKNEKFRALINGANKNLEQMGYTEHGLRHVGYVSKTTANLLREIGCDVRTVELGAIAGWIHDIGNVVNRKDHGHSGAILSFTLLNEMGMSMDEISLILGAIGNHEEETGCVVSDIGAALILADKSDAHRSRVRKKNFDYSDIHDRVNMAIKKNFLAVDNDKHIIKLVIFMDDTAGVMDYLQIYLTRMALSEQAASFLGYVFELVINGSVINSQRLLKPQIRLRATEKQVSEETIREPHATYLNPPKKPNE